MRTLCKNAIRSIVILSVMATLLFTSCIGAQEAKTSDPAHSERLCSIFGRMVAQR